MKTVVVGLFLLLAVSQAFINIDQTFVQKDERYADFNISFKNTKDGQATILNSALIYSIVVLAELIKVKIFTQNDDQDFQYSKLVLETQVDTCNLSARGQRSNMFTTMLVEYLLKSVDVKYSCPLKKGFKRAIINQTVTDNLLPAFPVEQKFKVKHRVFSRIKERKGYVNTFNYTVYGRIKK